MAQMRDDPYEKPNMFSSEHFKRRFKAKIYYEHPSSAVLITKENLYAITAVIE